RTMAIGNPTLTGPLGLKWMEIGSQFTIYAIATIVPKRTTRIAGATGHSSFHRFAPPTSSLRTGECPLRATQLLVFSLETTSMSHFPLRYATKLGRRTRQFLVFSVNTS